MEEFSRPGQRELWNRAHRPNQELEMTRCFSRTVPDRDWLIYSRGGFHTTADESDSLFYVVCFHLL